MLSNWDWATSKGLYARSRATVSMALSSVFLWSEVRGRPTGSAAVGTHSDRQGAIRGRKRQGGNLILTCSQPGDARFAAGESTSPRFGADRRQETAEGGQHPFATEVSCSDARVAA